MTRYAVDPKRNVLVAAWQTGFGDVACDVGVLPADADGKVTQALSENLTGLSRALWDVYTARLEAEPQDGEVARPDRHKGFASVPAWIENPNLPSENGMLVTSYDPVEEYSHRIGRALHELGRPDLTRAVVADAATEVAAVEAAELGNLTGRGAQATQLTRADASPTQVAAACDVLNQNLLNPVALFTDLDPTAACVAAAHYLRAAAETVGKEDPYRVVIESDDIAAVRIAIPTAVIRAMDTMTAYETVTKMIEAALDVAAGVSPQLEIEFQNERSKEAAAYLGSQYVEPGTLSLLDPSRPARDMLEDLVSGIYACWTLFDELDDFDPEDDPEFKGDEDEDSEEEYEDALDEAYGRRREIRQALFVGEVVNRARATRSRLGVF